VLVGGACFGYFIVFPYGFRFFLGFAKADLGSMQHLMGPTSGNGWASVALEPTLMMSEYSASSGGCSPPSAWSSSFHLDLVPRAGRSRHTSFPLEVEPLLHRHCLIAGGVLTPGPDVVTQVLMAGPLIALYNISILIAYLIARRKDTEQRAGASKPDVG